MTGKLPSALTVMGSILLLAPSGPGLAAPYESLVVSQLADPDPNYVAPKPEPLKKGRRPREQAEPSSGLDQAFESFGRAIGQAAQLAGQRAGETPEQIEAEKREALQRIRERAIRPN